MLSKSNKKNGISLTPREIVVELDRCIIGQNNAKKAVIDCRYLSCHMRARDDRELVVVVA